jgi:hypothetical protein
MKKLFPAFLLMLIAAAIGFAQVVRITPKKTVYTRKGRDIPKEKKTFVVTYPIVSSAIPAATKKKLENTISYWSVFETTLRENQGEYHWLSELSYAINYNKNGVLDIALTQEGVGAYPDGSTVDLIIDLKTGEQVKFNDAFKSDSLAKFAEMVNAKLDVEKKEIIKSIDKGDFGDADGKEADDSLKEQLNGLSFTAETFDQYSIDDKGVTIIYDAGFPHVIQAAQPDGRYFFTWKEVKPFIRRDGLLAKFIR